MKSDERELMGVKMEVMGVKLQRWVVKPVCILSR
jgi:hypothetical protein